jgi:GntR family histidine utilization transcriptional repressor
MDSTSLMMALTFEEKRLDEATAQGSLPAFQRIKEFLLAEIGQGRWQPGDLILSESALVKQFGVSRMTVNRAVSELTKEQVLTRRQGAGTYVAAPKYQATLLEIKSIADEVRARGHQHRSQLLDLSQSAASSHLARQFELEAGSNLFHSLIVHFENEIPIQVEDRWVNPAIAPDYLAQDFNLITPNEYLMQVAPLQGANYKIEALLPTREVAQLLTIEGREPCLVLQRQTLALGQIASSATMWHPGQRYQFAGKV